METGLKTIEVILVTKSTAGYGHWWIEVVAKVDGQWQKYFGKTTNARLIDEFEENVEARIDLASWVLWRNVIEHDEINYCN